MVDGRTQAQCKSDWPGGRWGLTVGGTVLFLSRLCPFALFRALKTLPQRWWDNQISSHPDNSAPWCPFLYTLCSHGGSFSVDRLSFSPRSASGPQRAKQARLSTEEDAMRSKAVEKIVTIIPTRTASLGWNKKPWIVEITLQLSCYYCFMKDEHRFTFQGPLNSSRCILWPHRNT